MRISERDPTSTLLREIQPVAKRAREMVGELEGEAHPQGQAFGYR